MRRLLVVLAIAATGCATVKPIVQYTCLGCQALVSSGVCNYVRGPQGEKIPIPECKPDEQVVIENWKAVSREGAVPILGCETKEQ